MTKSTISHNEGFTFSSEMNVVIGIEPGIPAENIPRSDIILLPGRNIINLKSLIPADKRVVIHLGERKEVITKRTLKAKSNQIYILKFNNHKGSFDTPIVVYNDAAFKLDRNGIYLLQPGSQLTDTGIAGFNKAFIKISDLNDFSLESARPSDLKSIVGPLSPGQCYVVKTKDSRYVFLKIGEQLSLDTIWLSWEYID